MEIQKVIILFFALCCYQFVTAQSEITWKDQIVIEGTSKYVRLCKVTKGPAAGDLIMTYFKNDHSAPFGMRRSKDEGRTWSDETIFMRNDATFYYVNPGILQLDDGRLMLSYCKRSKTTIEYVKEEGPCVKFSTDGGYTWGNETFICYGGAYEPTAIQVPNDKDGDGNNDIYLFWTMALVDQSIDLSIANQDNSYRGFACGVVASYDNGKTWNNFMPSKLGARIVHRNFNEPVGGTFMGSKGNMPTPVLLPNHRIGVVCEAVDKANSPWFTVSDPGDWDWEKFQGQQWTDYQYFGYPPYSSDDDNIYPTDRNYCWRPTFTDNTFGGAPYACVLPNGKIAFSQNTDHIIRVFVCDPNARNPILQQDPFPGTQSFYSCIIPLNDHEVIVTAYDPVDMARTYIRIGEIRKDVNRPSVPENVSAMLNGNRYKLTWNPSFDDVLVYKYRIYANDILVKEVLWDHQTELEGLDTSKDYNFTVRAVDYQGNTSDVSAGLDDKLMESFSISPNPVQDFLNIKTPWDDAEVSVCSLSGGTIIQTDHFLGGPLCVSSLEKGIYLVQVKHKNHILCRKFIKL